VVKFPEERRNINRTKEEKRTGKKASLYRSSPLLTRSPISSADFALLD
jgi:hypothetical protein